LIITAISRKNPSTPQTPATPAFVKSSSQLERKTKKKKRGHEYKNKEEEEEEEKEEAYMTFNGLIIEETHQTSPANIAAVEGMSGK
jgi:hypothetical protein